MSLIKIYSLKIRMTFLDTDNVEFVAFRRKMVNMK